jgi:hypothetical protein
MADQQAEVNALVTARNFGDPMMLLSGIDQLDCAQLTADLVERRRDLDLFSSQIRIVEERRAPLLAEIATSQATRSRRATEVDAAAHRKSIDEMALTACTNQGIGMVNGECTIQERFVRQSAGELRVAKAALADATASLQTLQARDSAIGLELVSLNADRVAIEGEIDQIKLIMEQKGCPIPAA